MATTLQRPPDTDRHELLLNQAESETRVPAAQPVQELVPSLSAASVDRRPESDSDRRVRCTHPAFAETVPSALRRWPQADQ